ncbi:hypothetical protein HF576_15165 [Microbacterium sp. CFH 90308]|uniref:DUF5642 domain-containing protein n=1 Tax=Microbacterium salsuginis TaxID=2722803 RepID=A0ABX1KDS3_9MICO|nr:hypothetical protein [Microbacterium sp. CFH 90308]NLP85186.1 hypothetical protein [Microbacterium sp. CFH 90308]
MARTRPLRAIAPAALSVAVAVVAVSLGGCASAMPGTDVADPDTIAARASAVGIAPELVYTTEVDGYDLAPQSVGTGAADGMSATWFNQATGAMLTIRTDRGELTAASCAEIPLWDASDAAVTCTEEDGIWHRSGGGVHEYVTVRDGALIMVTGMNNVPSEDLLAAAEAVHVPSGAELELLFSDLPKVPAAPVERGDLPDNGDGAPIDPVGPGG